MAKSLVSWAVLGVFSYLWFKIGYGWEYLQDIPRGDWGPAWMLFTLFTILIHRSSGANEGASLVEAMTNRLLGIMRHLVGLTFSLFVGLALFSLVNGGFSQTEYIQAVIVSLGASLTTSLWLGALEDASK